MSRRPINDKKTMMGPFALSLSPFLCVTVPFFKGLLAASFNYLERISVVGERMELLRQRTREKKPKMLKMLCQRVLLRGALTFKNVCKKPLQNCSKYKVLLENNNTVHAPFVCHTIYHCSTMPSIHIRRSHSRSLC